jgi:two-component system nitrogen regulation sensor histidine kinase NtrY
VAGAAIVLFAWWLRNPLLPYGGESAGASDFSGRSEAGSDAEVRRLEALRELREKIAETEGRLRVSATKALDAPADAEAAFAYVRKLPGSRENGIVLTDRGLPFVWSGQIKTGLSDIATGTAVVATPFYWSLQVAVTRGTRRAVAMSLIHAEPPADRVAIASDQRISARKTVESFRLSLPGDSTGELIRAANGSPLVRIDATSLSAGVVRFDQASAARERGIVIVAIALIVLIALAWRDRRWLGLRLAVIAIALAVVALVPWNNFSNFSRLFDPAYYYLASGGTLAASSGVLTMSATLLFLAVIAIVRSRRRGLSRVVALPTAVVCVILGIGLASFAATGISLPPSGSTIALWLGWETPLFLMLFTFWLAALWLVRTGLDRRGAPQIRNSAVVAVAAATLAVFIVWRKTTDERLDLAARDIASLQQTDRDAGLLLVRLAAQLAEYDTPGTRADLLKRYVASDLAAADREVTLQTWTPEGAPGPRLELAPLESDSATLAQVVAAALVSGRPSIREALGPAGRQLIMAVSQRSGGATSVVVAPPTRLIDQNPYTVLLGLGNPVQAQPPYTMTLADVAQRVTLKPGELVWRRVADEWHGDELVSTSNGTERAHVEVDLRTSATRLVRGSLVVIFDIAIAALIWAFGAMAEGGFWRWVRRRASRWLRSYRGRLSLALWFFFILPAVAFATWSYQRLRGDDKSVRELLVDETLRGVAGVGGSGNGAQSVSDDTPLFLYSNGMLSASNDSLYAMLSAGGSTLPQNVAVDVVTDGEQTASWEQGLPSANIFWGYRATTGSTGQRVVLAAPARSDELVLDRRRRDLTLLVLFATALGAIAAFWLSGIAARILARDLEISRIEVSRAERVLAWGEMARQIAHEIKNPLTPIRLGVQHLRRARNDPRVDFDRVLNENVTRILSEIDHLDEIARAFSRYGSAPADLPPAEDIDVASILRDVVGLERIGISDVAWVLDGADEIVLARARGDELRDVLLNVFENARLARARTVRVRMMRGDGTVMIQVDDDGSGIPAAALNRVFEPHFSTRTTGSGLGLAISRRLLESWGGMIDLDSEEGRGAKVLITLQAALS